MKRRNKLHEINIKNGAHFNKAYYWNYFYYCHHCAPTGALVVSTPLAKLTRCYKCGGHLGAQLNSSAIYAGLILIRGFLLTSFFESLSDKGVESTLQIPNDLTAYTSGSFGRTSFMDEMIFDFAASYKLNAWGRSIIELYERLRTKEVIEDIKSQKKAAESYPEKFGGRISPIQKPQQGVKVGVNLSTGQVITIGGQYRGGMK